ncbi:hypothetical protein DPX39_100036700 [Trypanosoma brucei equiperdum]|uniref:Uncharacterized protein n=1 Tax=Trypanosoma brucei equiperdum TaxID=630700 RepID=A0A3L6L0Q3_9TRYP|nr:hypothetical protein DPX39_100036700 [Trypanosoma brucei equiperdum]
MSGRRVTVENTASPSPHSSASQQPLQDIISSPERQCHSFHGYYGVGGQCGTHYPLVEATAMNFSAALGEGTSSSNAVSPEQDPLLEGLREKERQFDARVAALDKMLICAQQGCTQRDSLIDRLNTEVGRLRKQLQESKGTGSKPKEMRGSALEGDTTALEEARAKIEEMSNRLREKSRRLMALERQLGSRGVDTEEGAVVGRTAPRKNLVEEQGQQKRARYAATLRSLQKEVGLLEQKYRVMMKEKESLAEENQSLRRRVDRIQEDAEAELVGAVRATHKALGEKKDLETQVMATRLSMARLLHVLSEVPEMSRYLRVDGVTGDLLFIGYAALPLKETADGSEVGRSHRGGLSLSAMGTGVDDGIYGGSAKAQSHNIYLNGKWCNRLREIVDDENCFFRRAKVHTGELEDVTHSLVGESVPRVPLPSDVLQGRQRDRDFWIPYGVFVEAQKFKNRYFPSMNVECFYPFLFSINVLWNKRMMQRVTTATKRVSEQQERRRKQMLRCMKRGGEHYLGSLSPSTGSFSLSPSVVALRRQLQLLRREVQRRVIGRSSLDLFHRYDLLVRRTLQCLEKTHRGYITPLNQAQQSGTAGSVSSDTDFTGEHVNVSPLWRDESPEEMKMNNGSDVSGSKESHYRCSPSIPLAGLLNISQRASTHVLASCRHLRELLEALRKKHRWFSLSDHHYEGDEGVRLACGAERTCVPVSTLHHLIEGVVDFVGEVQQEVLKAHNAVEKYCTHQRDGNDVVLSALNNQRASRIIEGVWNDIPCEGVSE